MNIQEIRNSLNEVEHVTNAMDEHCRRVIEKFGVNSLRRLGLSNYALRALKRELRNYNANSQRWEN